MNTLEAVILGFVEGVTEFLPVSSTAHLMLAGKLMGIPPTDFSKTFDIAIQLGAILAVVCLYARRLALDRKLARRVLVAFLPAAIIGFLLYKTVRGLLGNDQVALWALFLGGIFLIVFEFFHKKRQTSATAKPDASEISYKQCLGIGLFQSLALVPGVSRSGATIVGGLCLGLDRRTVVEFSFLLAVPTMVAATALDLWKNAGVFTSSQTGVLLVGGVTSFGVALFSIRFLLRYIERHDFTAFGVYRLAVALAFWLFVR